ncbi:AMP-binding protein [Paracoccus aminophilus]|uniref:Feruloyl-CoA synthase n=1 Tax=Paracoccus aminophilus JCM 7686 TaxID=1367847 RepID=S5XZE2_PARAH|nr:AMP-binding protein [Paracoccus aminophilus]AGT08820.1 feruloyl-CoA synthase [Paracoccus aminophilus JCM 7686]
MTRSPILGTRADGALTLANPIPLPAQPDVLDRLRHWARVAPDRVLISAEVLGSRHSLSYAEALTAAESLHWRLAAAGLRPGARIATLLPAGLAALSLRLACLMGGYTHLSLPPYPFRALPACPPTEGDAGRLWQIVQPALLIVGEDHSLRGSGPALALADLPAARPVSAAAVTATDWSAIFFTAGSTGASKGVPITRGMISSCQAACAAQWPFLTARPPVLIDWMPWNHVFGGLDNLFKVIWNGGSLHLAPPPSAEGIEAMLRLMAEVQPTLSIGVPLGLTLILDAFDTTPELVLPGFARLTHLFFAGAAMAPALWERLTLFRAAVEHRFGHDLAILSGYGATEAASTMCLAPGPVTSAGVLGWPLPGHEIALVETEGRREIRFRGPNLAPCYLTETGESPLPLDDFGFYRTGDAGIWDGTTLRFDGRLAEDFKLASGIKVRAGVLRAQILKALAPLAEDLVLGGEGREGLVALVFGQGDMAERLAAWNRANPGSSTAIARFIIADFAPDAQAGEVSAKGQIVQSRMLRNRAALFEALSDGKIGTVP